MRNLTKLTCGLIVAFIFFSCSEEERTFAQSASLSVVHAASGAPSVHVDYFGETLDQLNFSINPTLAFASSNRFVIPSNEARPLVFTYASDTTTEVFSESVSLEPGQIATFYLVGDSANLSSRLINDTGFVTFSDSANAVRFINLAEGVESLNIGIQDSTATLASSLAFGDATEFITVDATLENERYTFTFNDPEGNQLTTFRFDQWLVFNFPGSFFASPITFRKNVTFVLVGQADDGEGNSTLQVARVDNF